jgi:hypothetical protein
MPSSLDNNFQEVETLFDGMSPVSKDSGFRMDGYFVWGGSVIKVGSKYNMFASRWPEETGFPSGYITHSEIVRAEADSPLGPYIFREVVIHGRGGEYWDGGMAHNPTIHNVGSEYVLFYNACEAGGRTRRVGYAAAKSITGPWRRIDEALPLSEDANNPVACFEADGEVKLAFRDRELKMGIAVAPHYNGIYKVLDFEITPEIKLEDPYIYHQDGMYHIICEDNRAQVSGHERWGVHLVSEDSIHNWHPAAPVVAYTHTIAWEDGIRSVMERRERPQLIFDDRGGISHLCTGVLYKGKTWCLVQLV